MRAANDQRASTLLGYPPDARLLIVNADDFGMCHANNEAILRALREGIVTSTSLMVPCPWAPQAMQALAAQPEIDFGIHLTLVCDFQPYRWGPLAERSRVPSLVDGAGFFFSHERRAELIHRASLDEVEVEFRMQIETVLAAGLRPTHLDWHCLADGGRADIFDLSFSLAREYRLAMRAHEPLHVRKCLTQGLPVAEHGVLDSYSLDSEGKADRYAVLLRALPPGLSEWAVHPGLGNDESRALEPQSWRVRRADFDFVISPAARNLLNEEGIVLLGFRPLQERWVAA